MDTLTLTAAPIGAADLKHAFHAEAARLVRETRGDVSAQTAALHGRLVTQGLLTADEAKVLGRLGELGEEVGAEKRSAVAAYVETREHLDALIATPGTSPVALVLASVAVGGYEVTPAGDGSDTMVVARTADKWENRGAAAGAAVGALWGPAGALVGGFVGGVIGGEVDKCLKD